VAFVHEAIHVAATPSKGDDDLRIERLRDRANAAKGHVPETTALHARNAVLRLPGTKCDLLLRPRPAMPQAAQPASNPEVVHRTTIARRP
jgi:hypothetical protein